MARGRVITADFWTDGNMIGLSAFARLFYIGLWNHAYCDKGHLPDDPMGLKLKVLPADHVDPVELIGELQSCGRVVRLEAGGKSFLFMPTFATHQKADTRWKTRCPACALEDSLELTETRPSLPEHTETHPSSALRGEKRKGKEDAPETRADVSALCDLLADLIEENGSLRPKVTQGWLDAARLLLDKDGRQLEQAMILVRWSQQSSFWRSNILSMPKFRDQFDKLRLARNTELERATPAPKKNPDAWMNQ